MANESQSKLALSETSYILEGNQKNQQPVSPQMVSEDEQSVTDDTRDLIEVDGCKDGHQTNLPMASFNFINSIVGSGVIGIPYALHQAGFGMGLILLVLVAWVTDYSLVLMIRSGHLCGKFSYQGLMEAAFGRPGFILLSVLQFTYPFIAMVSYNVAVGDTLTKVFIRLSGVGPKSIFAQREFVVGITTLFITLPLCLYKDIARLAKVSFMSLIFVAFILVTIVVRLGTLHDIVPSSEDSWNFFNWGIIPAIGIMAFAFMCHHNTFLLYESIEHASQQKWNKVTHASVLTSLVVSTVFGIAGYATFTGYSQGDLLENYCWTDDLMNVARIVFSATIILTYPLECFVTREVVENLFLCWRNSAAEDTYANSRHYTFTFLIIAITYCISMGTDCLGVVQELNGILAAIPLAYVLPALTYVKLEEGPLMSRRKMPALLLGVFGILVTIIGVALLFIDKHDSCSHGVIMPYCLANQTIPM